MAVLALMLPDAATSARFASALEKQDRVIHATGWRQLLRLVMSHPVDLCAVDPYDPFRPISLSQLQRLRRKHPDLAIVIYSDFQGREAELFDLGRLQVDGVLQASGNEPRAAIRHAVDRALARAASAKVTRALAGRLPPFALDCLGWAVEHAENDPRVADLAAAVGATPRSLGRDLKANDLPSPSQILVWGRIFQASRMLQSPGTTVDGVAYRLGYATGGALRRALKLRTGSPPRELVARGGLDTALQRFIQRLTQDGTPEGPSRERRRKVHWARWRP